MDVREVIKENAGGLIVLILLKILLLFLCCTVRSLRWRRINKRFHTALWHV